jgi:hypothetical protein
VAISWNSEMIQVLPKIIAGLAKGIIKNFPEIFLMLLKLMVYAMGGFIFDILTGFLNMIPGVNIPSFSDLVFHEGGMIPGAAKDVPIIAQSGEGVLSRKGMMALGGVQQLNALNSGKSPFEDSYIMNKFHDGGLIGYDNGEIGRSFGASSMTSNTSNSNSLSIGKVEVSVSGDSRANAKRIGRETRKQISDGLAKDMQDRKGKLYKVIKKDRS